MNQTKMLVVGMGEIGNPLFDILDEYYDVDNYDKEYADGINEKFHVIHICFGHKDNEVNKFIKDVSNYQKRFLKEGGLTIIHSTVAVGVSRKLNAVHSPIIGIHPNLEEGIRTFIKFFGGQRAGEAAEYFRRCGIKTYITDKSETTELMKILDTTFYGVCIEYTKEVKRLCDEYEIPFEMWTLWTDNYNKGYIKLGQDQFIRPNLTPIMKKLGGHCILSNATLLDNKFTKFLIDNNA